MHDFRKLLVWQLARDFGAEVYELCAARSKGDRALMSQLRRSALSIATNIAEGCGKSSRAETVRYLDIAAGSAAETEHHLEMARKLGAMEEERCAALLLEVASIRRMLRALIEKLPT